MRRQTTASVLRWTSVAGLGLAVEIGARLNLVGPSHLVPVTDMVWRLWEMLSRNRIPSPYLAAAGTAVTTVNLGTTLEEIGLSFLLAVLIGVPLGMLLWRRELVARILTPYINSYYAIPIFSLYPLFLVLFGRGILPVVTIGFLFAVMAIALNVYIGFRAVDAEPYPKVGRSLRLTPAQMFRAIYLPAATPHIFTGLRLGIIYSIIGCVASEFITSLEGWGRVIVILYDSFDTENMYAAILLVIVFAVLINSLLGRIEDRLYSMRAR